ncbi:hypothetical protein bcere0014_33000 [Bacillus cereus BDRD-ST196]|nr:hypothetical protein bcere0014_33000 [Bacillus cereus BDRD-ST196]
MKSLLSFIYPIVELLSNFHVPYSLIHTKKAFQKHISHF